MPTLKRIQKIFIDNFELEEEKVKPEATLESLGLDSLDKIDLIFALEDEFKIKIDTNDIKVNTVGEMVESIEKAVAGQEKGKAKEAGGLKR